MDMKIRLFKIIFFLVFFPLQVVAGEMIVPAPPTIKASSYVVMDFNSGDILVEQNTEEKLPPASLTKIMTIYVVASELANGKKIIVKVNDRDHFMIIASLTFLILLLSSLIL